MFLKILSERKLFSADEQLEKLPGVFCPVTQVLRKEKSGHYVFDVSGPPETILILFEGSFLDSVNPKRILDNLTVVRDAIKNGGDGKGSFAIPETEELMKMLHCASIKPTSQKKADILLKIHDERTGTSPTAGFSIKSRLGGASTLLNASGATNFIYSVSFKGKAPDQSDFKEKIQVSEIEKTGGVIEFERVESNVFEMNLREVDSSMHGIVAEMVLAFYERKASSIADLSKIITEKNPHNINLGSHKDYYSIKIKNLLLHTALGMLPNTPWDGSIEALGGYIVAKENGEIVCYHVYDFDKLKEYLFLHTKLETPSTTRYGFGKLDGANRKHFIKLNLQIRFTH